MVLLALREENLAKIKEEKWQKILVLRYQVREREKKLKRFWKSKLNQSKNYFLKTWNTMYDWSKNKFDRSKNRFDQSNQAEAH